MKRQTSRRALPLAALGACLAILAGTPGTAWGLAPVPRAGHDTPRVAALSGEEPGDDGAPAVPPAVREELGPAPTPVPDEVVRAPAPPASGVDGRDGATAGAEDGTGPAGKPDGRYAARLRAARAACPPTSVICLENTLPGNPASEWDVPGAGSTNIQGFGTTMSVAPGETMNFKVNTAATSYRIDIYRIGYYGGMGARKITTINPSAALPQLQPTCVTDAATQLVDCGNWAVSASWPVPDTAVSGVYIANLIRQDGTSGASQMIFVVRDDTRGSDILLQTSDATWQAYNTYGGASLYLSNVPPGRAYKVSYNRPFTTRGSSCCNGSVESWFFNSEYPMVRWMEANGYDVSYTTNVDTAGRPAELLEHRLFISSGHDEYWSEDMRANAESARDGGVNLAFFSGNEIFWKTRWENSIDGTATPYRTIVCYKETLANAKIDPSPQWTGSWRDPRFSPPSDGGRPENGTTGTLFTVNGVANNALTVPYDYAGMRLWRNTSVASLSPGQVATFPAGTLGYEWDEAPDNPFMPSGLAKLSQTVYGVPAYLVDFGGTFAPGVAVHGLTLYKHTNGALVFGAGTTQWAWGLDATHDRAGSPADIRMQQATVNLLADMGLQPASLQAGLVPATASTDTQPPTSAITNPPGGATLPTKKPVAIQGTAADTGGGVVAGVEVSVDGGTRWFEATGLTEWQYVWTPTTAGPATILVRAVDDSGNVQQSPTTMDVTVTVGCPCTLWTPTAVPTETSHNDPDAVEGGLKFQTSKPGLVESIRFYKGDLNTGTHVGNLWSADGRLLATATFTNETASGWQQVDFSTPVHIAPGTTYIASYHTPSGFYSVSRPYFTAQYANGPLTALADADSGGNGVYTYGQNSSFPTSTYQATNYWVDVVFSSSETLWDNTAVPDEAAHNDPSAVTLGVKFTASTTGTISGIRFYKGAQNTGTHVGSLWSANGRLLATATFTNETASGWQQVNFGTPVDVNAGTTYVASYHTPSGFYSVSRPYFTSAYTSGSLTAPADAGSGGNGVYAYGSADTFPTGTYQASNYWVDVVFTPSSSLWDAVTVPQTKSSTDSSAVTLGVKFYSEEKGTIRGIRFYKGAQNTGTHVGSLWSANGQLLATATFTNETASGWQQVAFSTPVTINPDTTYIASYHTPSGHYSTTKPYFTSSYTNGPLTALSSGQAGGNGVYAYGSADTFPTGTYQNSNYWVDVLFDPA
ncbi:hypothetical protein GCM10017673_06400 [Streptosporangium violaceochromogenes]|nr:hypothetical protein GCM10017673_06400 [Streptosporangium violaceochromogenes]